MPAVWGVPPLPCLFIEPCENLLHFRPARTAGRSYGCSRLRGNLLIEVFSLILEADGDIFSLPTNRSSGQRLRHVFVATGL